MAKKKTYRLYKIAQELNIGSDTVVSFLTGKGFSVEDDVNFKLSEDMCDTLIKEFDSERKLKQKANKIKEYHKNVAKGPLTGLVSMEDAENSLPDLTAEQLRTNLISGTTEKEIDDKKQEESTQKEEIKEEKPEEEKPENDTEAPIAKEEQSQLKVVGNIDLEKIERKRTAKKKTEAEKTEAEKTETVKDKPEKEELTKTTKPEEKEEKEAKVKETEEPASQIEEETIRAIDQSPKLVGLTIKGSIDLPVEKLKENRKKSKEEKRKDKNAESAVFSTKDDQGATSENTGEVKQKRKRKRKKSGVSTDAYGDKQTTGDKSKKGHKKEKVEEKEVQKNIKNTLSQIDKGASRKGQMLRRDKRQKISEKRDIEEMEKLEDLKVLNVTEFLTASEMSSLMDVSVNDVIQKCMELGLFVSINQRIESDVISLIAEEFGFEVNFTDPEETFDIEDEEEDETLLEPRSPIVTVMGHVDHGKTSLLDYVRKENVIAGEAGGITQHIGAYSVTMENGQKIAFLDTPGHEAFTAMRARGAQVTDIAVIVIAADDQIMPQTKEAINHAQAAGVPMVFAINKVDKEGADPNKIKEQLSAMNILVEDWGGQHQSQEVSAKTGLGINELMEKILLQAELLELKANPNKKASGTVVEAQLDKGRGVVTNILIQSGTLKVGDILVANCNYGRVKAMVDERQHKLKEAGPSTPVQILGLDGVPQAGDRFKVMETDREARELANKRQQLMREQAMRMKKHITLEEIARRSALEDFKELKVIVKGDVDGSVEALVDSLIKLSTDEAVVDVLMKGVGQISESDVLLAAASDAIIVGFQVRPSANARKLSQKEHIDIRLYSIIYDAINEIRDALEGMLAPKVEENIVGMVEVREIFKVTKVGTIAGCMVTEGKFTRNTPIRLIRDGIVVYSGNLSSLKRFKDDVKEVQEGFECGMGIENFNDIKVGDVIEGYETSEVKRTL